MDNAFTIDRNEVGAHATIDNQGDLQVKFGIYLPNITASKGYQLLVRVIHHDDQFIPEIPPKDFPLTHHPDHRASLWDVSVNLTQATDPDTHFGQSGTYLYRYQLLRLGQVVSTWFTDPFAYETGAGELAAFTTPDATPAFEWTDDDYKVPPIDELVVYELHVGEFNDSFQGIIDRLDYLQGLGVNVLELMPIGSVKQEFDWGYGPIHFWAPEERFGRPESFKQLVNACHAKGIAVILDAVYEHVDDNYPYHRAYADSGEASPMIGPFGEGFFGTQTDLASPFTQQYFRECNRYWLEEYHVDGFRYDYVPGMYDGPTGVGYAKMVFDTYQDSLPFERFKDPKGFSRIIQCAEHLPDPRGILRETFSNCTWQNDLLNKVESMADHRFVDESFVHLLETGFSGYPDTRDFNGIEAPVAPFQYIETHDHSRLINRFGQLPPLGGEGDIRFGDRSNFFKLQPFAMALYTCVGIPMLWQGQEFAENYTIPGGGNARISVRRGVHWEFFYDQPGQTLVKLYRTLARLRRDNPALRSRNFFYFYQESRPGDGIVAYRRWSEASADQPAQDAIVILNFSDFAQEIWLPFPEPRVYQEKINENPDNQITVAHSDQYHRLIIPSNYGHIYLT